MGILVMPKSFLLFLFLFLFYEIVGTNNFTPQDFKEAKLDDCGRCKVLTDSINYWIDRTSRGKYEGGDAAWEEAKLKSYSRSEIRLIEIQEGLCSELKRHQDVCYAIADDAEQVFEKWWFSKDPVSVDLYTWLCIEALHYCCPSKHYGDACSPCPLDRNNDVCSGRGRCDGAGTRKGNGTCICKKGYTGSVCNECAKNFFQTTTGSCKSCHKSCKGCNGEGATGCKECSSGWQLKSGVCVDIDECLSSSCEVKQYCINTDGSYSCKDCDVSCKTCLGEGPTNCTSCESTNVLWFGMCIDSELKQNILISAYKRFALYMGLLIISFFISRTSTTVASVVVFIIAIFMYFSEKNLKTNTMDVVLQMWYKST